MTDFEVVFPYNVDETGNRVDKKKIHKENAIFLLFKAFGTNFHINASANRAVIHENQLIEHHTKSGIKRLIGKEATYTTGTVLNSDQSMVALEHSDGMVTSSIAML